MPSIAERKRGNNLHALFAFGLFTATSVVVQSFLVQDLILGSVNTLRQDAPSIEGMQIVQQPGFTMFFCLRAAAAMKGLLIHIRKVRVGTIEGM